MKRDEEEKEKRRGEGKEKRKSSAGVDTHENVLKICIFC